MTSVISGIKFIGGIVIRNTIGTQIETESVYSARYYYSVWLRHLIWLYQNGITDIPEKVIEFGPGASLGTGLCALLSGTKEYRALDAFKHVNIIKSTALFEEIIKLFENSDLRYHYGENARQRFNANFSQSVVYSKVKALYQRLGICEKQALVRQS